MHKAVIGTIFALTVSACGGGGTDTAEVAGFVASGGITFKRADNPSEGVRWRIPAEGVREVWFDPELGISEDVTYVPGTAILNTNSSVKIMKGDSTRDLIVFADTQNATTTIPSGTWSYYGEAVMLIDLVNAGEGDSGTIQKFGNATMQINFDDNTGELTVASSDGKTNASSSVSTYAGTWLKGSGTFSTSGDQYVGTYDAGWGLGCSISTGCGIQNVNRIYDSISEATTLEGSLTGANGQGAMGVLVGNNHAVGISLE